MAETDWRPETWETDPGALFDLSEVTAIVTGGASGLGRAIAIGLDAHGADVVVADIDLEGAEEVVGVLGDDARAFETDVTDAGALDALREAVLEEVGDYDAVVNLPGINVREPVLDLDEADWASVLEVNLTGTFLAARHLGGHLVDRGGGSLVNMASALGLVGLPNQGAYSASKGGVVQFTRTLAAEWAPEVRVNAIAPGYVETPLVVEVMADREWYEAMRERHMLERFARPEEVVGAAVYLVAGASSFVTGAVLSVDGGWTAW